MTYGQPEDDKIVTSQVGRNWLTAEFQVTTEELQWTTNYFFIFIYILHFYIHVQITRKFFKPLDIYLEGKPKINNLS